jgi:RimJ/RimL family protein N-acetyltransferase
MIIRFDKNQPEHVKLLLSLYYDPTAAEFFRRAPRDLPASSLVEFETMFGVSLFVLIEKTLGNVGLAILSDVNHFGRNCQAGFVLKEEFRDHHYFKPLFYEFLDFIFESTAMEKVSMTILQRRQDLSAALKEHGFKLEAVLQDNIFFQGEWHTEYAYAVLRKNYAETKGAK